MKLSLNFTIILGILLVTACARKPSYSQIESDQSGKASNQNVAPTSVADKPSQLPEAPSQPPETAPQITPNQATAIQPPAFFDSKTGQIRDLPSYPRSRRIRISFGPINGFDTMILQLTTRDPIDKVVAFYDQAIKGNGWSIVENNRDANNYQWTISKESGQGVVQVALQPQGPRPLVYVSLQRAKAQDAK